MARTVSEGMFQRCQNLNFLISQQRGKIKELEKILRNLQPRAGVFDRLMPNTQTESQKVRDRAINELNIERQKLQDLLNDFRFDSCSQIIRDIF